MRPLSAIGMILIVLGVLALSVHSVTYFTHDHEVGPFGFFTWEASRPHTIFVNPIAGAIALVVGLALVFTPRGRTID